MRNLLNTNGRMSANEILGEMRYEAERGALTYEDVRYLLIRPETLCDIQKALEKEVGLEIATKLLIAGGRTGGLLSSRRFKEEFQLTDEEAVKFMCRMGRQIGWGAMRLQELDSHKSRLVVEVADSPFAKAYGSADHAVCHLIRGVFAGMAEGLFERKVKSQETKCLCTGNPICRFEIEELSSPD